MHCCLNGKAKNKKKRNLEVALPSAMTIALGKENLKIKNKKHAFRVQWSLHSAKKIKNKIKNILCRVPVQAKRFKKTDFFAECRSCGTRQRVLKKIRRRRPSADGVKSLPSARTALGKAFAECPKFGTRQSSLYRKGIRRRLFAECCTRQRLCRVQSCLCRVQ